MDLNYYIAQISYNKVGKKKKTLLFFHRKKKDFAFYLQHYL